ncbi:hypothetical protein [Actinomarinicola tropica]|uniref:Uncharacterized protein n=1 Tax=Actinomarinicola tropica TaxID=2789776 RepID=A0A5Q2RK05_9ACTN|nr:hypothetical protein [Actinomarinicola tropica]QGG95814.1 hypothetical protein GH723_12285 [Actinomarinicola tropica]
MDDDQHDDAERTAPPPPPDAGPRAEEVVADALERLGRGATEVAETMVGLGVLGVNRLQSLRRDLAARAEQARERQRPDA